MERPSGENATLRTSICDRDTWPSADASRHPTREPSNQHCRWPTSARPGRIGPSAQLAPLLTTIKWATALRSAKSHRITVASLQLVARSCPSGESAKALIEPRCSIGKDDAVPEAKSHTSGSARLPPPVTSELPSGANAKPHKGSLPGAGPVRDQTRERSWTRQSSTVPPYPPTAASSFPSRENASATAGLESVSVPVTRLRARSQKCSVWQDRVASPFVSAGRNAECCNLP